MSRMLFEIVFWKHIRSEPQLADLLLIETGILIKIGRFI